MGLFVRGFCKDYQRRPGLFLSLDLAVRGGTNATPTSDCLTGGDGGGGVTANDLCGTTVTGDLKLDHDSRLQRRWPGRRRRRHQGRSEWSHARRLGRRARRPGRRTIGCDDCQRGDSKLRLCRTDERVDRHHHPHNSVRPEWRRHRRLRPASVGNTVKDNLFQGHTIRAIMLRGGSSDNDVKNNTFIANRIGVLVFGATDTELKDNLISESTLAGIRFNVAATGNTIKDNILTSNLAGIDFVVHPHRFFSGERAQGEHLDRERMRTPGSDRRQHFQGQHLRRQRRERLSLRPSRAPSDAPSRSPATRCKSSCRRTCGWVL